MNFKFHKYPQNQWAAAIIKVLKSGMVDMNEESRIVDAPCGNGIIAHFVNKALKGRKITALDNNPELVHSAYVTSGDDNLDIKVDNIFEFRIEGTNNIWLLINSLYCLPFKEQLISGKKDQYRYIIAVFPDIKASNFKYFTRKHPEFDNPSAMTLDETRSFFEKEGYRVLYRKDITRLKFHALGDLFSRLRIHNRIKNIIFSMMDYVLFLRKGQYELMLFTRNE